MIETRATTTSKYLQNTMFAKLHDDIQALEVKFQNQLNPLETMLHEVTAHIKCKTYLGHNYDPQGEETSTIAKDPLSFGLFISPTHTMGDTCHEPRGTKLDMQKFDGTDIEGWVSQMNHFFCLHNINTTEDKYKVSLLYLDVECWQWWQWHKRCIGGHIEWFPFPKKFVVILIRRETIWEG